MKKSVIVFGLILVLSLSVVSAFSFSDYWNKITGRAISPTTCADDTPVGSLIDTGTNKYLCDNSSGLGQELECWGGDNNKIVGVTKYGFTCQRWGWYCGNNLGPAHGGFCCDGVNSQTECVVPTTPTAKKNGQDCSANSECSSGNCVKSLVKNPNTGATQTASTSSDKCCEANSCLMWNSCYANNTRLRPVGVNVYENLFCIDGIWRACAEGYPTKQGETINFEGKTFECKYDSSTRKYGWVEVKGVVPEPTPIEDDGCYRDTSFTIPINISGYEDYCSFDSQAGDSRVTNYYCRDKNGQQRYCVFCNESYILNETGDCVESLPEPEEICTDSDGGKNYALKGNVSGTYSYGEVIYGKRNDNDYCIGSNLLREYYCREDGYLSLETIDCNNDCNNGVCTPRIKCVDGTFNNECSLGNKPKYCNERNLVNDCNKCGCNYGYECKDDGDCQEKELIKIGMIYLSESDLTYNLNWKSELLPIKNKIENGLNSIFNSEKFFDIDFIGEFRDNSLCWNPSKVAFELENPIFQNNPEKRLHRYVRTPASWMERLDNIIYFEKDANVLWSNCSENMCKEITKTGQEDFKFFTKNCGGKKNSLISADGSWRYPLMENLKGNGFDLSSYDNLVFVFGKAGPIIPQMGENERYYLCGNPITETLAYNAGGGIIVTTENAMKLPSSFVCESPYTGSSSWQYFNIPSWQIIIHEVLHSFGAVDVYEEGWGDTSPGRERALKLETEKDVDKSIMSNGWPFFCSKYRNDFSCTLEDAERISLDKYNRIKMGLEEVYEESSPKSVNISPLQKIINWFNDLF